jgi:NAD(P)-dependent dehydrogenase (short-subunit alcohol dehydrogenase family)
MKTVIITGAAGNLGKACVERFLADGYKVIATVTPGKDLGFQVKGHVETYDADLSDEKAVNQVVSQVVSKHKTIDAALLLVGGYTSGGINDTDGTILKKMISLNFDTAYFVARPVFQQMMKQGSGGRIVLVGARPALRPKDANKSFAYALSKSLIFKLAEFLNGAGSEQNVTTCVVVPSTIDTPSNRQAMPGADFTAWVKAEDIAATMAHVCSEESNAWRETVVKIYNKS